MILQVIQGEVFETIGKLKRKVGTASRFDGRIDIRIIDDAAKIQHMPGKVGELVDRFDLARRGEIDCKCKCGWAARGQLVIRDRYTTDYPPIPWVDIVEVVYDDESGGEHQCPNCEGELEIGTVIERDPDDLGSSGNFNPNCFECPGGNRCDCKADAQER